MQSTEQWRPVVGFEGLYEVSDHGSVRGVDRVDSQGRVWRGRVLRQKVHSGGYLCVNLWRNGRGTMRYVHRLVLESFVGPAPDAQSHACHGDGDQHNNKVANLRWGTASDNARDRVRHGTNPKTRRTACPRGHLLVEPNLVPHKLKMGHRSCLACAYAWTKSKPGRLDVAIADARYAELVG